MLLLLFLGHGRNGQQVGIQKTELASEIAATIADEKFWDKVDNILKITEPIYKMIKFADGEGQKMWEVYERMDCMIGKSMMLE